MCMTEHQQAGMGSYFFSGPFLPLSLLSFSRASSSCLALASFASSSLASSFCFLFSSCHTILPLASHAWPMFAFSINQTDYISCPWDSTGDPCLNFQDSGSESTWTTSDPSTGVDWLAEPWPNGSLKPAIESWYLTHNHGRDSMDAHERLTRTSCISSGGVFNNLPKQGQ